MCLIVTGFQYFLLIFLVRLFNRCYSGPYIAGHCFGNFLLLFLFFLFCFLIFVSFVLYVCLVFCEALNCCSYRFIILFSFCFFLLLLYDGFFKSFNKMNK